MKKLDHASAGKLAFRDCKRTAALIVFVFQAVSTALAQAPSTDIWLLEIDHAAAPAAQSAPRRVTDRAGYDNQPSFLPDGSLVFTSMTGESTNILRWDPKSGEAAAVVTTPESEYSATPVPGHDAVSVIRDYGDLKQQLWRYPLGDGEPQLLLPDVNPVGYHAWIDDERLLLFVLGEPATLQLAVAGPGEGRVLADNPGRALARIPSSVAKAANEMSFVHKLGENDWRLKAIDPESGTMREIVRTLSGSEDYTWAPDGSVWMGSGSQLYRFRPGEDDWKPVADLGQHGLDGITRMAFDPTGRWLAIVANR